MFTSILDAIIAIFQSIPILSKWFTKSATQTAEEDATEIRKEMDNFQDTGRPQ